MRLHSDTAVWAWAPVSLAVLFCVGLRFLPAEKTWVDWLQALLVPSAVMAGAMVAYANLKVAMQKRKDDLFDRQFEIVQRILHFREDALAHFLETDSARDNLKATNALPIEFLDPKIPTYEWNTATLFGRLEWLTSEEPAASHERKPDAVRSAHIFLTSISDFGRLRATKLKLQVELIFGEEFTSNWNFERLSLREMHDKMVLELPALIDEARLK